MFALPPNKTRTAYEQFFTGIRNNIQFADAPLPTSFDFKVAAISAAKKWFLDADVIGCLFLIYHVTLGKKFNMSVCKRNIDPVFALFYVP